MKEVLILCNGMPPSAELFEEYRAKADYLIGADGGAQTILQLGGEPDIVTGDMDSFDHRREYPFEIRYDADQETNDLEKALWLAADQRATHVSILGATGQRLDQTLKNLSVLKQFNQRFESLHMADDYGRTRLIGPAFEEEFVIGTKLSLFPLSGRVAGITTSGLKYSLNNEALENGVRDGSSNEVTGNPVRITYTDGDLLLYTLRS